MMLSGGGGSYILFIEATILLVHMLFASLLGDAAAEVFRHSCTITCYFFHTMLIISSEYGFILHMATITF